MRLCRNCTKEIGDCNDPVLGQFLLDDNNGFVQWFNQGSQRFYIISVVLSFTSLFSTSEKILDQFEFRAVSACEDQMGVFVNANKYMSTFWRSIRSLICCLPAEFESCQFGGRHLEMDIALNGAIKFWGSRWTFICAWVTTEGTQGQGVILPQTQSRNIYEKGTRQKLIKFICTCSAVLCK